MSKSIFAACTLAPPDPILGTALAYKADTNPKKVNLGIGAYRTEEGKPLVLNVVRKVEQEIANDCSLDKEYAPIDGFAELKEACQRLLFGKSDAKIVSCQALSGTGALRLLGDFAAVHLNKPKVYVSKPTWGNHHSIFQNSGLEIVEYPYWDNNKREINFSGMIETISTAPAGSLILLHACAHNPTGMDPTKEQWQAIRDLLVQNKLTPIIDNAYQGYASGDMEEDSYSQRLLFEANIEMFVCQSFAKNFGLYGERMGMLHIITQDSDTAANVMSQLKLIVRAMYSSPPIHGAKLISKIINDPTNLAAWQEELQVISGRIASVRMQLCDGLKAKGTPGTWDHINQQIGMFSFTGLSVPQSERMVNHWHIYMLKNGRISLAGLNKQNLEYVIDAIDDCVRNA